MTLIFPLTIIILSIGASFVYAMQGDWKHAGYFAAAAVLNICVIV